MDAQFEKMLEVQREAWNNSSAKWKKWDNAVMEFLSPMNNEMIRMLQVRDDDIILDVATGTGEPGLTIASLLKKGKVVGLDLAEEMLAIASENATRRGIQNFETICSDVSTLPFKDESFDGITCRLGFMFFPDMQLALKEMMRVLKPGGQIVASVWNVPEKNLWVSISMERMISMLQLKVPAPGAPGIFRCAQPGCMADMFKQAGLNNLMEHEVIGRLPSKTLESYWNFVSEVSSPLAFSKAEPAVKEDIKKEVLAIVSKKFPDGNIELESNALVIRGEK